MKRKRSVLNNINIKKLLKISSIILCCLFLIWLSPAITGFTSRQYEVHLENDKLNFKNNTISTKELAQNKFGGSRSLNPGSVVLIPSHFSLRGVPCFSILSSLSLTKVSRISIFLETSMSNSFLMIK